MRKLRIFEHISLDGVIQHDAGQDEHGKFPYAGWTAPYRSEAGAEALGDAQGRRADFLLGRRSYDIWSKYWPKVKGGPFADALNTGTKYVVTHRPDGLEWGPVEVISSDIVAAVRRIKSTDGPDLVVWGSSTLVPVLLDHGLVDDLVLAVYPVLLGRGKRVFSDSIGARELSLVATKSTPTGVLINTYRHVGSLRASSRE
jgi:dihydrofolate reductase